MASPVAAALYAWNGQQNPYSSVKGFQDFQWLSERPEWGVFARTFDLAGRQDLQGFWTGSLCVHQAQWANQAGRTLQQIRSCNQRTHICVVILPEDACHGKGPHDPDACRSGCEVLLFNGPKLLGMESLSRSQLQLSLDQFRDDNTRRDLVSRCFQAAEYSVQQLSGSGRQQHDQALGSLCKSPGIDSPHVLLVVPHDTGKAIADAFSNASRCVYPDCSTHRFIWRLLDCPVSTQEASIAAESILPSFIGFSVGQMLYDCTSITEAGLTGFPHSTKGIDSGIIPSTPITHNDNLNEVAFYHKQARTTKAERADQTNDSEPQSCTIRSWLNSQAQGSGTSTEPGGAFLDRSPPIEHIQHSCSQIYDTRASSDCSNGSEDEWASFDEWTQTHPSLKTGHPLLGMKEQLVQAALEQYNQRRGAAYQSTRHEADMLNAKKNQFQLAADSAEEPGKAELACPFYKTNPVKYARCLKFSRLDNMGKVKQHLVQQHRLPFYCPVCKKDFQTARARDQHIIRRTCSLRHGLPFEGVSDDQRRLLARQHKRRDRRQQWRKICELLDLQSVASESPHVKDVVGQEVVSFKDFWRKHGQLCVADFLQDSDVSSWDRQNEERDLACLYSEVLFGALDVISQRSNQSLVVMGPIADRTV